MYNLFVTAQNGAWDKPAYKYELDRAVREHTVQSIRKKYESFSEKAITDLTRFPALFLYEKGRGSYTRIGWIKKIRRHSNSVVIEYEMERVFSPIRSSAIHKIQLLLDIDEWEFKRTHWAIKDVDLFSVLLEAELITKAQIKRINRSEPLSSTNGQSQQLVVSPKVFKVSSKQPETDLVSVMMPFDADFALVYESIKKTCKKVGLRCSRADDIWEESVVIQDIFNLLYHSCIVVADFSGRNPNVMYETGIAHTLGRSVIPIAQSLNDIPFNLRHHRCLKYLLNKEGLSKMRTDLEERLKNITSQ